MKLFSRILLLLIVSTLTVLSFQNCQKSKEVYEATSEATPTPQGDDDPEIPSEDTVVTYSASEHFTSPKTFFNFDETIYQRVEYLGQGGKACQEVIGVSDGRCDIANNFVSLFGRPGWNYNSETKIFTSTMLAKDFHGRRTRNFFKKADGTLKTYTLEAQSLAAASTSDVWAFYSIDAQGSQVRGEFLQGSIFYSHVKNGNTSMKSCVWLYKLPNGSVNTVPNHCTVANLSDTNKWATLPAEAANIDGGNNTMLTYQNAANTFPKGTLINYINTTGTTIKEFSFIVK